MDISRRAPDFPGGRPNQTDGYPSRGNKLGPAWQEIWERLADKPREFQDGYDLAEAVAPKHDLAPVTLVTLLKRAATAGLLEREHRDVKTTINRVVRGELRAGEAFRKRTHYRLASGQGKGLSESRVILDEAHTFSGERGSELVDTPAGSRVPAPSGPEFRAPDSGPSINLLEP